VSVRQACRVSVADWLLATIYRGHPAEAHHATRDRSEALRLGRHAEQHALGIQIQDRQIIMQGGEGFGMERTVLSEVGHAARLIDQAVKFRAFLARSVDRGTNMQQVTDIAIRIRPAGPSDQERAE
jgi:hypothetical protein